MTKKNSASIDVASTRTTVASKPKTAAIGWGHKEVPQDDGTTNDTEVAGAGPADELAQEAAIDTTNDTEGRVTVMGHIDDETYGDDKNDHDTTDDTDTTDSRDTQGHTDGGADVESAEDRADREAEAMPHAHTPIGVERAKRVKRAPVTMEQITNYQSALVDLAACANKVERDEQDVVAARKVLAGMIDALNTTKVQYRHAAEQVAECAKLVTMPRRTTKADA